jgi:hypothetical protein
MTIINIIELVLLLPVAALANWQVIETYNHGSLFSGIRAYMEARQDKFGELLSCMFCLSHWTAALVTVGVSYTVGTHMSIVTGVIYTFAVTRLSQLGNDCFYFYGKTPRVDLKEEYIYLEGIGKDGA